MNRSFSAGAAVTFVIGMVLLFAINAQTLSFGSFSMNLSTVGMILAVVGAVLFVISLIPRRTHAQTRRVDSAGRESVTDHDARI